MAKVRDIHNFFNSRTEADTRICEADVSQSESLIDENEIKK